MKQRFLPVQPLNTFLGKSEVCRITELSRAFDKTEVDRNTILIEKSGKNGKKGICMMVEI